VTSGRAVRIIACAVAAPLGLAVAVVAGGRAHAELVRKPTALEISAAAATGVAQRWEREPAGQLFPASIAYTTSLNTTETASRVGARAFFSEQNSSVLRSAPGVGVIGAGPGGEYLDAEGTSPSAALVSGVAALIRSRYPALSPALVVQALITSTTRRPSGGYSTGTGFGEVDAAAALRAAGRLAAAEPATGLAAAQFFGSPGSPGRGSAALRPIQVVHRNTRLIIGYSAAAYGGAVCAIIATVLLIWTIRRSRRDRRQAPSFPLQQPAQPEQVPHARVDLHPARHPGAGDVHRRLGERYHLVAVRGQPDVGGRLARPDLPDRSVA